MGKMDYLVYLINIVSNHYFAGDLKKGYRTLNDSGLLAFNDEFYDVQHTLSKEVLLKEVGEIILQSDICQNDCLRDNVALVRLTIGEIMRRLNISYMDAMDLFYQSITAELLSYEYTGYITYSHLDLAKLVIEEQKVNSREEKIDIHVEGKVLCV